MGLIFKSKLDHAREETNRNQAAAADPAASAWVSANAGTGKTHVLTMRVLRLMLAGTAPERILALTYTKAAAAEMSKRVFGELAKWVTLPEGKLREKLQELLAQRPSAEEMTRARQLFAVAIETPGGLKAQTIHAFCERLLQRFPLEAGVPPGFAILDEAERAELLRGAVDETLADATADKQGPLARAMTAVVGFAADMMFDEVLGEALRHEWLRAAAFIDREAEADGTPPISAQIYRRTLGLANDARLEDVESGLIALLSDADAARLGSILASSGSANDAKASERMAALRAAGNGAGRIRILTDIFLTTTGDVRKSLMTKPLAGEHPDADTQLSRAQGEFVRLHELRCKLQLFGAATALLQLGHAVMQRYAEAKARRAALDFDDLVARAAGLLGSSRLPGSTAAVEWVLFKLDGGLDHILVDEAQDTSALQWQVIRSLAEEFFAGKGARDVTRTMFAVGDEKQSIYSFQGAAPDMFAAVGAEFATRAGQGRLTWQQVPLTLSFRAVEPLLKAVDSVFANPARTPGVVASAGPIRHVAHRAGQAGLVEIWPTEKLDAAEPPEPWSPLAEIGATSPIVRLAARIAIAIQGWLKSGERLLSENRPVRAGDILILVRKRAPFAAAMVSALKARGIGVAGADRLILTEQIAVQDLIALGDFLVLEDDDLALAAVLKSPLFGLDDNDLLRLAPKRKGSLWQVILDRAPEDKRMRAVAETLARWRTRAAELPPFEFYAGLLDAEGMRAQMLARLGAEAADPIDEFVNLALSYDDGAPPSLQGFLSWLRAQTREVKRDMEQGRNEVRVMTVHGAKGLEAPIVVLPDTCTTRSGRRPGGLLNLEAAERPFGMPAPFIWPVKGTSRVEAVRLARQTAEAAEGQERDRLLYVALTRARDRLYVAGFEGRNAPPADCWYNLIKEGLAGQLQEIKQTDGRVIWRLTSAQTAKHEEPKTTPEATAGADPLPTWAKQKAPAEPLVVVPLIPSRLAPLESEADGEAPPPRPTDEPPVLAPQVLAKDNRLLRGTLTHALLEHLPGIPRANWKAAAEGFLASRAAQLPPALRKSIAKETLAILNDPTFAALFGPDSRAEVAIVAEVPAPNGRGPALRLTGKIDRLARDGDSVLIVDYKTNRPPPTDLELVPVAYLLQLAAYRLGVARIFPQLHVRAAILWTDGPRIMEIPAEKLETYQRQLWELAPASLDA